MWTKPTRTGRMKGVLVYIDQETWESALKASNIPVDTPIEQIRVKRYPTNSRNIIMRVKRYDAIPDDEKDDRR